MQDDCPAADLEGLLHSHTRVDGVRLMYLVYLDIISSGLLESALHLLLTLFLQT